MSLLIDIHYKCINHIAEKIHLQTNKEKPWDECLLEATEKINNMNNIDLLELISEVIG